MKSFGFVHVLLIIILLVAYQCAKAQNYILTTKGDSLTGAVKMFNSGPELKAQVVTAEKKRINVPMLQVKMIKYEGDTYRPQRGPDGYTFMKLVKEGYLSLYAFQFPNQASYDGLYLLKRDGTMIEVPNINFKKALKKFLADCADVATKVESGEYTKRELDRIIDDYNRCIADLTTARSSAPSNPTPSSAQAPVKVDAPTQETWTILDKKVQALPDFSAKADALEMIQEIKNKLSRGEKIPNFMIEGLKTSLKDMQVVQELEAALADLK